jgi:hypothetical protein
MNGAYVDYSGAEDEALAGYAECAVWTGHDWSSEPETGNPTPLDDAGYSVDDIADEALASMRSDVAAFLADNADDIAGLDPGQVGHDFWLTRNRHGTGFWDRGLDAVGTRLTDAAHAYGETNLYVGDDGKLYVS